MPELFFILVFYQSQLDLYAMFCVLMKGNNRGFITSFFWIWMKSRMTYLKCCFWHLTSRTGVAVAVVCGDWSCSIDTNQILQCPAETEVMLGFEELVSVQLDLPVLPRCCHWPLCWSFSGLLVLCTLTATHSGSSCRQLDSIVGPVAIHPCLCFVFTALTQLANWPSINFD